MKKLLSCAFNHDSGCVEPHYSDESTLAIDCTAVENRIETNANGYAELDRLLYKSPLEYVELVLNGELETYLKCVSGPYSGIGWNS